MAIILMMALSAAFVGPSSAVAPVGIVCVIPTNLQSCPVIPALVSGVYGTQVRVSVFIQGSGALNSFDIILLADHTVLKPSSVNLTGTVLPGTPTIYQQCIGGVGSCSTVDSVDTLHLSAAGTIGQFTSSPITGLLFTAIYNVTGSSPGMPLGYQTGCVGTSVSNACVTITGGTGVLTETVRAAVFSNRSSADKFSDAFYYTGVDSLVSSLYGPASCGSGLGSIHEAPSFPYNWWTDDAAKFLGALAYAPTHSTEANGAINFLNHLNLGGYVPSRCVQITPSITDSSLSHPNVGNNLYIIRGNPTLSQSDTNHIFSVSERANPTISQAYMISTVASINDVLVNMDTGQANPIRNPGNDANVPLDNWVVNAGVSSSVLYYHSPIRSFGLGSSANITQIIQAPYVSPTFFIQSLSWWDTSDSGAQGYNARVYYNDGTFSTFAQVTSSSSPPGVWQQKTVLGSSMSAGKNVVAIGFLTASIGGSIYLDDVSLNTLVGFPTFGVATNGPNVVETQSLSFNGVTVSIAYTLAPGKPYVRVTSSIYNGGSSNITRPTIYNAFDGLDTIGSGYAYIYMPGIGFRRPSQNSNLVTQAFGLNGWNDNWLALDVHGNPDWIGTNSIFVNFDTSEMPQGAGPWRLNQVTNTIFQNSTTLGPTNYLHWFQMSMNSAGNLTAGQFSSYDIKYVFAVAHDWTNMGIYGNYFSGTSLDTWNNVYPSMNFYEGEIAYEAALYSQYNGGTGSLAYPIATSIWNYYNRMIRAESNGTYTGSLSRFVDASIILNQITGNSTYLVGMKVASTQLLRAQYNLCCDLNMTRYNFHYCPTGCATINTISTFGNIFNITSLWGSGRVISGTSINVGFFQSPRRPVNQNISGTMSINFWMNANTASVTGYYYTQLFRVNSLGATTFMAASANQTITLPAGAGSAPFKMFTSTITISPPINVPANSALEINLQVKVNSGSTAYVCFDSSANCPSYLLDPDNPTAQGKGGFRIPPSTGNSPTALPQTQPVFLDLTALAGQALFAANVAAPNSSYVASYTAAIKAIRWGTTPAGSGQVAGGHANVLGGAPNSAPRLYIWANTTYIDVDFSTYKAGLVVLFALPLNQTLANIAISRLWDRVYMPNPPSPATFIQVDTGEAQPISSGEMNSETQPWGLTTWLYYTYYWRSSLLDGNSPQFIAFSNLRDTLQSVSGTTTSTTLVVNGTASHTIYVFTRNLNVTSVAFNTNPIAFSYVVNGGGPLPGVAYVYFSQAWTAPGTFVITGTVNTGMLFLLSVSWPLYEARGSWALTDITVTLSPVSGSTGNVSLGCPVLPVGVQCAFSPGTGIPAPTFDSVLNMSSNTRSSPGSYLIVVQGSSGTYTTTVSFSLVIVQVGSTQLFMDDFVQQSILPSSSWTQDWIGYSNPLTGSPGNARINSGNLDLFAGEVHVNQPAFFDPVVAANNSLIVRKLTVGLVPFATISFPQDEMIIGWGPLNTGSGDIPPVNANAPCLPSSNNGISGCFDNPGGILGFGGAGIGSAGSGEFIIGGDGAGYANFCGAIGYPCRHVGITSASAGFDVHSYAVLTIKYQVIYPGPAGQNWMTFRVYQPGNSFDVSLTFTFANGDYHLINPVSSREFMAAKSGSSASGGFSAIDIVQWQDFGSPVLLTPPPRIPFPTAITGNGLIGLFLLVATSLGFGNAQIGIILEFMLFMAATAFPIAIFTRSMLSTATVVLVISAMFVYAGFLPTLIIFIEMLAVAGIGFMTFQKIISGGGGGEVGSYGGED